MVDIFNPKTGMIESRDIEIFAKQKGSAQMDDTSNLIDLERIKQIIMINFDELKSLKGELTGHSISKTPKDCSRITIAIQYLTTFANRTYNYRIPCIQGLASFNNEIILRCLLSPFVLDFENNDLNNIEFTSL